MKSGDYGLLSAFLKRSCYESFSDPLRSCVFGRVAHGLNNIVIAIYGASARVHLRTYSTCRWGSHAGDSNLDLLSLLLAKLDKILF